MRVTMVPTKSIFDEQKGERRLPASYIEWMSDPRDLLRKPSDWRERERKKGSHVIWVRDGPYCKNKRPHGFNKASPGHESSCP